MGQNSNNLFARMAKSEDGATAIIYALCMLPLILVAGFSIDLSRMISAENHVQTAVDNAALASALDFANSVNLSDAERLNLATETFNRTLDADLATANRDLLVTARSVSRVGENGIRGEVTTSLALAFGGLFGQESVDIPATSAAEASPPQDLEIVLALDNTVSMFRDNRFNLMRSAAKDFTNTLMDASTGAGAISIGIVPWASTVNINSERPGGFDTSPAPSNSFNAAGSGQVPNAAFEDRTQYLLAPEEEIIYTAEALEADFGLVDWRGCIRTAPGERETSQFGRVLDRLTDEPVQGMRWHVNVAKPHLRTVSFSGDTSGFSGEPDALAAGLSLADDQILRCDPEVSGTFANPYLGTEHACKNNAGTSTINTLEACVSDPNEFDYLNQGGELCPWRDDVFPWTSIRPITGPNMNCPAAMLGLSEDRSQIIEKLDEMYPVPPGTHADIGLMWGLRMLSPQREWASFFGQSLPTDYTDAGSRKIMVLLTDGENFYPRVIEGYYGCQESRDNQRGSAGPCFVPDSIGDPSRDSLDALMLDSCEAIREDYGIELFTIAVDITSNRTIDLLADCAADPDRAFNISASEIDAVFESIAAQELRLLQ